MFYAKLENGAVVRYPYTLTDLRFDKPYISFPASMTDSDVAPFGLVPVQPTNPPIVNYTKNLTRSAQKQANAWVEVWTVSDASQTEISARLTQQWSIVKAERDRKLADSDWTQLPDVPLAAEKKAEWASYRQALRNVTQQADPFAIVWPIVPA